MEPQSNFLNHIRLPELTDKELIAVNLTAEYMSIDSEHRSFFCIALKFGIKD